MILPALLSILYIADVVISTSTLPVKNAISHNAVKSKPKVVVAKAVAAKNVVQKSNFKKLNTVPAIKSSVVKAITKPVQKSSGSKQGVMAKVPAVKTSGNAKPAKAVVNPVKAAGAKPVTSPKSTPFRLLGQPVVGYQSSDGKFNHIAYAKAMKSLASRQKATAAQVITTTKGKKSKRAAASTSDNNSLLIFGSDVDYPTPLITTFGIGTPPQQIPFFINFESSETVVFSSETSCTADGGFNITASSTVSEVSLYPGGVVLVESPSESIDLVPVKGEYITDIVSYRGLGRTVRAGFVYATTIFAVRRCYAQLGMSLRNGVGVPASLYEGFERMAGSAVAFSLLVTSTSPEEFPTNFEIEIMIGGRERSKFIGKQYTVAVSKTAGLYTNHPWKLNFGRMQVNGLAISIGAGTVTFSLLHPGIHLDAIVVKAIYAAIPGSSSYQPPAGPLLYTYPCESNPVVAFTIPGATAAFSIDPIDFNMGFSPNTPGQCIGAVQLPNDSSGPVHTIGLVFYKSWYTTYNRRNDTPVSITMAKARK